MTYMKRAFLIEDFPAEAFDRTGARFLTFPSRVLFAFSSDSFLFQRRKHYKLCAGCVVVGSRWKSFDTVPTLFSAISGETLKPSRFRAVYTSLRVYFSFCEFVSISVLNTQRKSRL